MASISTHFLLFFYLASFLHSPPVSAKLSSTFYSKSCPVALAIIKTKVTEAVVKDRRMAASLLRLHFHDCFVNGCDGSVLLDDTETLKGEKTAFANKNSARGFEVVDSIKSEIEAFCPQTVSCADILAVAARDSVLALGGPMWTVPLGRRDSTTASLSAANRDLPPPFFDLNQLISSFAKKGLSTTDMVALSGAHTIGKARCSQFRDHIYEDDNIDPSFADSRKKDCPRSGGDNKLAPMDKVTENIFDNLYFKNLVNERGLLHSDQELFNNASTDSLVRTYSRNMLAFFADFKKAMVKMGNIDPLTGTSGEIRTNCRVVNS